MFFFCHFRDFYFFLLDFVGWLGFDNFSELRSVFMWRVICPLCGGKPFRLKLIMDCEGLGVNLLRALIIEIYYWWKLRDLIISLWWKSWALIISSLGYFGFIIEFISKWECPWLFMIYGFEIFMHCLQLGVL